MRHILLVFGLFLVSADVVADENSLRTFVDAEISAAWQREKVDPAPPATDEEFLRRVYLDLVGVIPTHEEAASFLDDRDPAKRTRVSVTFVVNLGKLSRSSATGCVG